MTGDLLRHVELALYGHDEGRRRHTPTTDPDYWWLAEAAAGAVMEWLYEQDSDRYGPAATRLGFEVYGNPAAVLDKPADRSAVEGQ